MIYAVIIDDEEMAISGLQVLLNEYCTEVSIIGTANDYEEGIHLINEKRPQLVFLDIEMPHGSGFSLLEKVKYCHFQLIFTTAYAQYAIKAIKHNALDYLMKPIYPPELREAVEKAKKFINKEALSEVPHERKEKLVINTQQELHFIEPNEITRCESQGNYTRIVCKNGGPILVSQTLSKVEEDLIGYDFIRIHQSHLINACYITSYQKQASKVKLKDGSIIDVSSRKKNLLLQYLRKDG